MSPVRDEACAGLPIATISVPAGRHLIGGTPLYPEESPQIGVELGAFEIDATEVTHAAFADFVEATGHVTDAERPQAGFDSPGGAVFSMPTPTNPDGWRFVDGASWRAPDGPGGPTPRADEPVVQVTLADARAYAKWAGRSVPSEAEWEAVANTQVLKRGDGSPPQRRANSWQGVFPVLNTAEDGHAGRAPVGCYAPNALGAYDMVGNVWEWTDTAVDTSADRDKAKVVIKGGSYLCADNYCRRDRPISRQFQETGLPSNHIGFRTVRRLEGTPN